MRKCLIALVALALVLAAGPALAFQGKCLLKVDGRTYLSGPCNIDRGPDGTFTVGVPKRKADITYWAVVNVENAEDAKKEVGTGYWNEDRGANHAHTPLGALRRDGACWINDRARVCAWRK